MFNSPCSTLWFLTSSLYPLCTIALSPSQNTISQLKLLCHLVSCLKLISFSLKGERGGSNVEKERRQGSKDKKRKIKGAEEDGERQRSKDSEQTCGRTKESCSLCVLHYQIIMCFYHIIIMESSLPQQPQP